MSELQWTKAHQNGLFGNFVSNKMDGFYGSITMYTYGQCAWRVVGRDGNNNEYFVTVGEADSLEATKEAVAAFIDALVQFDNDCDWSDVTPEDLGVDDLTAMVGGGQ